MACQLVGMMRGLVACAAVAMGLWSASASAQFLPPGAAAVSATVQANSSGNLIAASVSGTVTSVAVAAGPSHGTASVSGLGFSYTPATNYVGSDSFTYVASGPGGTSAPATVSVAVVAAAPTVSGATLSVPYGQPATIDLASFVQGPTFTGITLAVTAPPGHGSAAVNGTRITYTPNAGHVGPDTLSFTATAVGGTSPPAVLSITVGSPPDPTRGDGLAGLWKAGTASVRHFQSGQLDGLHGRLFEQGGAEASAGGSEATSPECGSSSFALWTSLQRQHGAVAGGSGFDFTAKGLTLGGDRCFGGGHRVGLAIGYGRDDSTVRADGSKAAATASSLAAYGSVHLLPRLSLHWMAGGGRVQSDQDRLVAELAETARGQWFGSQWLGSTSANYDWRYRDLRVTYFGRVDVATLNLDGFTESGGGAYALRYQGQRLRTERGMVGLNAEYRYDTEYGRVVPRLRIEYLRDFAKRERMAVSYAAMAGGTSYLLPEDEEERRLLQISLGGDVYLRNGLTLGFHLGHSRINGGGSADAAQVRLNQKF